MIMSSFKQPLSLHVLLSLMFVTPYLCNWVNNDDVHQGLKAISGNKNIHSSSGVVKEKVGNILLNMFSTLQINSYDNIFKCFMG
jgi:hypothetical protein